ncbi:MAG: hypothetical protein AAGJ53_03350, partial [Pseudomonadota bacterium]
MLKSVAMGVVFAFAVTAGVLAPTIDRNGTVAVTSEAEAGKLGRALKRAGRKIKNTAKKAGSGIKKAAKKTGSAVKKAAGAAKKVAK